MTDKHTAQQAAETTLRAMAVALDARGITVSIDDVDEYNVELFWLGNNPEHTGDFVRADTLTDAFIAALHEKGGSK